MIGMEQYRQDRLRQERKSGIIGICLTATVHLTAALFGTFTGYRYIYPPPQEQSILLDFSADEEVPKPVETIRGRQPQAERVDRSKNIELVQASEAQRTGTEANLAAEAVVDDFGDVDQYEVPREKEINRRALFSAADNKAAKDTLAAQTAARVSDALKAGHASGNTSSGKETGEPNARVKGRSTVGVLPKPRYNVQESGIVVVRVVVNQYGDVTTAQIADGTTVHSSELRQAAINAAKESHFNQDINAPAVQEGTITYKFNLR